MQAEEVAESGRVDERWALWPLEVVITAELKRGRTVGPWTLRRPLGHGGNADVWEAERDGELVALKILRKRDVASEPFARFRIETDFLQRVRPAGVVPILESYLPASLGRGERAWVAMPVATPIVDALGQPRDLEKVCSALAEIANTLVALGIVAHRDIKPGNLYFLNGKPAVGDFGLISYPGKEDLTDSTQELGPRNFMAPEMIMEPAAAEGRAADVYSLAKVLWALACDQPSPPPGQFRPDEPLLRLSSFVKHPRIYQLEELLEHATVVDPAARPSMAEFRDHLRYFMSGTPSGPDDVRDAAARVRGAVTDIGARIRERTDSANRFALYEVADTLEPVRRALSDAGLLDSRLVDNDDILYFGRRGDDLEAEGLDQGWTGGRAIETTVKVLDNFPTFRMLSGIALEVDADEDVAVMVAAHARNLGTESEKESRWLKGKCYWMASKRFDIGDSNARRRGLEKLGAELLMNLRPALERFAEDIAEWRFNPETAGRFGH